MAVSRGACVACCVACWLAYLEWCGVPRLLLLVLVPPQLPLSTDPPLVPTAGRLLASFVSGAETARDAINKRL